MEEHLHFEAKQVEHHPVWGDTEPFENFTNYFAKSIAPPNQPEEDSIVVGKGRSGEELSKDKQPSTYSPHLLLPPQRDLPPLSSNHAWT